MTLQTPACIIRAVYNLFCSWNSNWTTPIWSARRNRKEQIPLPSFFCRFQFYLGAFSSKTGWLFFLYAHPRVMVLGKNEADHEVHSPVYKEGCSGGCVFCNEMPQFMVSSCWGWPHNLSDIGPAKILFLWSMIRKAESQGWESSQWCL